MTAGRALTPYPQFTAELRAELNARAETILKELEG